MSISKGVLKEVAAFNASSKAMKEKIKKVEQGYFAVDTILHDHRKEYSKQVSLIDGKFGQMETDYQKAEYEIKKDLLGLHIQVDTNEGELIFLRAKVDTLSEHISKLWNVLGIVSGILAVILFAFSWYLYYGI